MYVIIMTIAILSIFTLAESCLHLNILMAILTAIKVHMFCVVMRLDQEVDEDDEY